MSIGKLILSVVLPIMIAAGGAAIVCIFGKELGLIDVPNERSSHLRATPRGGGVGIWITGVLAGMVYLNSGIFAGLCILVGFLGIMEDRFSLSVVTRLTIQLVLFGTIVFFYWSLRVVSFWAIGSFLFWLLLITWTSNLYNFMDGINGIAGLMGIVSFGLVAGYFYYFVKDEKFAILSLSLSAACVGFLFMNFPKAKVFMGDVGSTFLGFVFGFLVMVGSRTFCDFFCIISFLFMFYVDELVSMFLRLKNGENLLKAHRKHLYQILANEKQIAHWKVSLGFCFCQLMIGISTIWLRQFGAITVFIFLVTCFLGFVVLDQKVRKGEV